MASQLVLSILELPKRTTPDWAAMRTAVDLLSPEDLGLAYEHLTTHRLGVNEALEGADIIVTKAGLLEGVDTLQSIRDGDQRHGLSTSLSQTHILIVGGQSHGDEPFDGYRGAAAAELLSEAGGFV